MISIGLVRHGSTQWTKEGRAQGNSDLPLDKDGQYEVVRLAERLKEDKWSTIYSSDLLRAKQTAQIISDKIEIPIIYDQRLREVGGGQIEGTTEEERIWNWGKNWRELNLGIESSESVINRVLSILQEISINHINGNILIISHGSIINHILRELVTNIDVIENIKNTSITKIMKIENKWMCELFNCTYHLEK